MFDPVSYIIGQKASGGGGGGGDITVEPLSVTENNTYTAPSGKAYSPVTVSVPNSYSASDEGKVVDNGVLVAQTAHAEVTQNGMIDTTLNNSVVVNVSSVVTGSYTPAEATQGKNVLIDTGINFSFFVIVASENPYYNAGYRILGGAFYDVSKNKTMIWLGSSTNGSGVSGSWGSSNGTKSGTSFKLASGAGEYYPGGITYNWWAW